MTKTIEYRVRPVTRYIVTRFESEFHENGCGSSGGSSFGEYDNEGEAKKVMSALFSQELVNHPFCKVISDGIIEV